MNQKMIFCSLLSSLASMIPGYVLAAETIAIYDRFLSPLGYDRLCEAVQAMMTSRNSRDPFPSIREIRDKVTGKESSDQEAALIASNITAAVSKIGPHRGEEAAKVLGEVGWAIVQQEGGWVNLCHALSYNNLAIWRSQWVRLAQGLISKGYINNGTLICLPTPAASSKAVARAHDHLQIPRNQDP